MGELLRNGWDILLRVLLAALAFLGGADGKAHLQVLLWLMALDYVTALLAAALQRSSKTKGGGLDSRAGFRGLGHKVLTLAAVAAAGLMDRLLADTGGALQRAVTIFYAANEGLSLLENLARCGVPVPRRLRRALEVLRAEDGASQDPAAIGSAQTDARRGKQ